MSNWIKTEERLPAYYDTVWTYSKEYDPDRAHVLYRHPRFGWVDPDFGESDPVDSKITHWVHIMPPPPIPED